MSILRKFLIPFSFLYGLVTLVRNFFYEKGIFKSVTYDFPVIGVGNLSVGGTGKTPMIEYLLRLLMKNYSVATLSRGYGRKTRGFYLLNQNDEALQVGDEPLQFKTKFPDAQVAVDEDRQRGISKLRSLHAPHVVLLDDAFQHRKVKAGLYILLTSYGDIYTRDLVLPAGNLRETAAGAGRAKIIVVTKCPKTLSSEEQLKITRQLNIKSDQSLFFCFIEYSNLLYNINGEISLEEIKNTRVALVTGIANPEPLKEYLKNKGVVYDHLDFPDHHNFSSKELSSISEAPLILTTEKDYMRLKDLISHPAIYYLPIKLDFINNPKEFDRQIDQFVQNEK